MRIIITGGGTAGHINPALSIANFIRKTEPESKILYVGAKGGMEQNLVYKENFDFVGIDISGFSRKFNFSGLKKNIKTIKNLFLSYRQCKQIISDFKPDVCVGTGGYASGPILKEASRQKIPFLIHEQNAIPGLTTKLLSKKASKIMLGSQEAKKYFGNINKVVVTGNPIRQDTCKFTKNEAKKALGMDNRPVILSFGGSLGARKINEAIAEFICQNAKNLPYNHIHAYGKYGHWFRDLLIKGGIDPDIPGFYIKEYIDDMPIRMASADIVICRAGAITLSELEVMGKPAILIPSPNVANNHQYHNAMELVKLNAATILEEKGLNGETLNGAVSELLKDKKRMESYSENLKKIAISDASERIYEAIRKFVP